MWANKPVLVGTDSLQAFDSQSLSTLITIYKAWPVGAGLAQSVSDSLRVGRPRRIDFF